MTAKPFFKGLSWLVLLNVIIKPIWIFGIDRQVQNIVGHAEYGRYFSVLAISVVLSFITDAGLTNVINRELALGNTGGTRRFLQMKIFLSFFYLALLAMICWLTGLKRWDIILLTAIIQVLTSFLIFFRNIITGHQLFQKDAWVSVIDKIGVIIICGIWLYTPLFPKQFRLTDFLYIQLVATSAALLFAAFIALSEKTNGDSAISLKVVMQKAAPFVLLILLMSIHSRFDAFLLERIHSNGAYEAGIYASGFRLLDAANTAGFMAASFLVPFVARNLANRLLIEKTVITLRHLLLFTAFFILAFTAAYSHDIMMLLYRKPDDQHAMVLVLCMAVLPAYYLVHIYGSLLNARGLFRIFTLVVVFSVIVNLVLNIFLIPIYGAVGTAAVAVISQYLCAFGCFYFAHQSFRIPWHGWSMVLYILTGVLMTTLLSVAGMNLLTGLIIFAVLSIIAFLMFVFRERFKKLRSFN